MPKTSTRPARYDMLAWTQRGTLVIWGRYNQTREEAAEVSRLDPERYFAAFPRDNHRRGAVWFLAGEEVDKKDLPFQVAGMGLDLTGVAVRRGRTSGEEAGA